MALRMVQPDVIREEAHPLPQALAVFAKVVCLAAQRRQGLPQDQGHPFDQAVLIVRPRCLRRAAPSTTRVLSVSSVLCFCLTNCP
jgi:hypothetical protein